MRLLCINPNTSEAMTGAVVAAVRPCLPPGTDIVAETARFGAPAIASRTAFAVGAHATVACFAGRAHEPWDAVLLACFGDPAREAMREIADVPVLGMAEAAMILAARRHGRFSVVTGGILWERMLTEFAGAIGLAEQLVSVRTIAATGGDIFRDPHAARAALVAAVAQAEGDGASCAILGGAALVGMAAVLRADTTLPLLDPAVALATLVLERVADDRRLGLGARPSPKAAELRAAGWI